MSKILVHANSKDGANETIDKLKDEWWALCFSSNDFLFSSERNLQLLKNNIVHNEVFLVYIDTIQGLGSLKELTGFFLYLVNNKIVINITDGSIQLSNEDTENIEEVIAQVL